MCVCFLHFRRGSKKSMKEETKGTQQLQLNEKEVKVAEIQMKLKRGNEKQMKCKRKKAKGT